MYESLESFENQGFPSGHNQVAQCTTSDCLIQTMVQGGFHIYHFGLDQTEKSQPNVASVKA